MKRKLRTYILLLLVLLLPAWPLQSAVAQSATVPVQALFGVNVRSGPGIAFPKMGELRRWEFARSTVTDGDWTIIRFDGRDGYVLTKYLREWAEEPGAGYVRATANSDVLNGPSSYAKWLGTAETGQVFQVRTETEDWYEINYFGSAGCVSKLYMEPLGKSTAPAPADPVNTEDPQQPQPTVAPDQPQQAIPAGDASKVEPAGKGKYVEAADLIYVYSGPDLASTELGQLYNGSIVPKLGTTGQWVQIEYQRRIAYVPAKHVRDSSYTPDMIVQESGYDSAARKLISLTNEYRKQAGRSELDISPVLMEAAKVRVQEITQVYSHTRPDGTPPNSLAPDEIFGENIARGTALPTPEAAAKGFMSSEAHRANALDSRHTKMGAACITVRDEVFWVQLFGK